jgi:triacylglycerol lipase
VRAVKHDAHAKNVLNGAQPVATRAFLFVTATLVLATTVGCPARQAAPDKRDASTEEQGDETSPPARVLAPSIGCLASAVSRTGEVPWDAALTLAEISNFAYSDDDEQGAQIRNLGATEVRPIVKGASHGVIASNDDVVVIAFRGTTSDPADWLTDVRIIGRRVANGGMHGGFYAATDVIFQDAYDEAMRQGAGRKSVWITGHSLGGAMAVAFAYRAANNKKLVPAGIITFGQPLVMTTPLAQSMLDTFKSHYMRFVNNWDPVTRLVPTFRHAGARIHLVHDNFTFRKPSLAYGASANATTDGTGHFELHEDDKNLEPMAEEEFQNFQQQVKAERIPPRDPNGQLLMRASIPVLSDHRIAAYIDRLQSIGRSNWK